MADNVTIGGVLTATQDRNAAGVHYQRTLETAYHCVATATGFNATGTSAAALAANVNREGVDLTNFSNVNIIAAWGATPVRTAGAEVGFVIPAFGSLSIRGLVDTRVLNVIAQTGTGPNRLLIVEWVKV